MLHQTTYNRIAQKISAKLARFFALGKQVLVIALVCANVFSGPALVLSVFVPNTAEAAFNSQINYQGKLTDSSGTAVSDGSYNMEFSLYTTSSGGTAVWTETLTGGNRVSVSSGLFSLMLGSTTALTSVDFNQTLYLGVTIGGSGSTASWDAEMTPRKILGAVPAAFESRRLEGLSSSQFLRADAVNSTSTASTFVTITQSGSGNALVVNGLTSLSNLLLTGSSTLQNFTANNSTTTNATSTNLAISNSFSVIGSATSTFAGGINLSAGCLSVSGTCVSGAVSAGTQGQIPFYNASSNALSATSSLFISQVGYLGIGTTSPWRALSVNGSSDLGNNALAGYFTATTSTASVFPYASTTAITASGTGFFGNLFATGSSTLQDFTFANATGTNATTTNFFATTASSTNLFTSNLAVGGTVLTTSGGNVGIGTASPSQKLEVNGAAKANVFLANAFNSADNLISLISFDGGTTNRVYDGSGNIRITLPGTTGFVGIGTTSPYRTLSVAGSGVFTGGDVLSSTFTATSSITTPSLTLSGVSVNSLLSTNASGVITATSTPTFGTFNATSTNATSTIAGGLAIETSGLVYDYSTNSVGIGTASPLALLNPLATTEQLRLSYNVGNYTSFTVDSGGNLAITPSSGNAVSVAAGFSTGGTATINGDIRMATGQRFYLDNSTNSVDQYVSSGAWRLETANTERITVLSGGNVGIGTTSPGQKLSVAGDILGNNIIGSYFTATSSSATSTLAGGLAIETSGLVYDYSTNNVGIGTASPETPLHISNSGAISTATAIFQNTSSSQTIDVQLRNSGGTVSDALRLGAGSSGYSSTGGFMALGGWIETESGLTSGLNIMTRASAPIRFYTGGHTNERLRIDENGNVGIGTTSPATTLSVAGNGYFTGGIGVGKVNTTANTVDVVGAGSYRIDGYDVASASTTLANYFFGVKPGTLNTTMTGALNTGLGSGVLNVHTTGNYNTGVGYQALNVNTAASHNTAVGMQALVANTTGGTNTAVGSWALKVNTVGGENVAVGTQALGASTEGYYNAAVGVYALLNNGSATSSVAVGYRSGQGAVAYSNLGGVYVGYQSGLNLGTDSNYNTLVGYQSGYGVTTGARNVLIGQSTIAASYNQVTIGSNNIAIGNDVAVPTATASNQLSIGNLIYGTGLSGTGATVSTGNIGIGTTSPGQKLSVAGDILGNNIIGSYFTATSTTASTFAGPVSMASGADYVRLFEDSGTPTLEFFDSGVGTSKITYGGINSSWNVTGTVTATGAGLVSNPVGGSGANLGAGTLNLWSASGGAPFIAFSENAVANRGTLGFAASSADLTYRSAGTSMTSGTELFRITSAGNVGIGTTSPWRTLSVNGSSDLGINALAGYFTATTSTASVFPYASTTAITSSGSAYFATSGGNVGVGITNPDSYDVGITRLVTGANGSGHSGLSIISGTSGFGSIYFGDGTDDTNAAYRGGIEYNHSTDSMKIWAGAQTSDSAIPLFLASNGNVGMGTVSPSSLAGFSKILEIDGSFPGLVLNSTTAGGRKFTVASDVYSGSGVFEVYDETASASRMVIGSTGNVGIGTTSPATTLSVAGNAYFTGGIGAGVLNTTAGVIKANSYFDVTGTGSGYAMNGTRILIASTTLTNYCLGDNACNTLYSTMTGQANTVIGSYAFTSQTTGTRNIAIGDTAMRFVTTAGDENVGIGFQVMQHSNLNTRAIALGDNAMDYANGSTDSIALGRYALYYNAATDNTAIGHDSLENTTSGFSNVGLGPLTLANNTTGNSNIAIGYAAARWNNSASSTVSIGAQAGGGNTASVFHAQFYTAIGQNALGTITTGADNNTAIGYNAGGSVTTGGNNILIGYQAGNYSTPVLTTGSGNIIIGINSNATSSTAVNSLNIGNLIWGTGLDGSGNNVSSGSIGIATSTPSAKFAITGSGTGAGRAFAIADSNNLETLTILDNGKVGIGTTSPGQKLSVAGDILGNAIIGSYFTATSSSATSTLAGGLAIETSGLVYDYSTNNVGIGTASPKAPLDVNSANGFTTSNGAGISGTYNSSRYPTLGFNSYSSVYTAGATGYGGIFQMDNSTGDLVYYSGSNVSAGSNHSFASLFTIAQGGNIGVGTVSPVAPLHVVGTNSQGVRISGGSSARLTVVASDNSTNMWNIDNSAGTLRLFRENYSATGAGGSGALGMTLANDATAYFAGNVGVGSTSPATTLSVGGSAYVTTGLGIGKVNTTANTVDVANTGAYKFNGSNVIVASTTLANYYFAGAGPSTLNTTATGIANLGIGPSAIGNIAGGATQNVAIGNGSQVSNIAGSYNTSLGASSLYFNGYGDGNVAIGNQALYQASSSNNVGVGYYVMAGAVTTGSGNVGVGSGTLTNNTSGSRNVAVGGDGTSAAALGNNTTGANNVGIGYSAGITNTTGSSNVFIGVSSNAGSAALNNATAIGTSATVGCSNCLVLGQTNASVGIGTTTPYAKLSVSGSATDAITFALKPTGSQTANILDIYSNDATPVLNSVITAGGNWGIGTTSPYAALAVVGEGVFRNLTATSTTATSTFSGGFGIGTTSPNVKFAVDGQTAYTVAAPTNPAGTHINDEAGSYSVLGTTHTVHIYSYKIVNGTTIYSPTYATATYSEAGAGPTTYNVSWSWTAASGATGYRLLKDDTQTGYTFNYYADTTSTSFTDTTSSWTAGYKVGPTVWADNTAHVGRGNLIVSQGALGVGTSTLWTTLGVEGSVALSGLTRAVTTESSLCIDSVTKEVFEGDANSCAPSSKVFKHAITGLTLSGVNAIRSLEPVSFIYNADNTNTVRWGFIAENAAAVSPSLAAFDENGKVRTINSTAILSLAVKAIKELATTTAFISNSYASTTALMTVDVNGNIGIGTSTPDYKLQVLGDVAATSFVNISTRTAKKDISYLSDEEEAGILTKIKDINVATYHYNSENPNNPLRLGLIAEEAPTEVLAVGGKGVDVYKFSTFLLAGIQVQQKKLEALEARVATLETSGGTSANNGSILSYLASFGVEITHDLLKLKTLVVDAITTKNVTIKADDVSKTGITIYDRVTGQPVCMYVANGVMSTEAGECATPSVSSTPVAPAPTSSSSSTASTDTTTAPAGGETTPASSEASTPVSSPTTESTTPAETTTATTNTTETTPPEPTTTSLESAPAPVESASTPEPAPAPAETTTTESAQ